MELLGKLDLQDLVENEEDPDPQDQKDQLALKEAE